MNESGAEPVYQFMVNHDESLWMDVGKAFFDVASKRSDVRTRALYATPPSSGNADAVREALERARFDLVFFQSEDVRAGKGRVRVVDDTIAKIDAALSSAPVAGEWKDITMSDVRLVAGEGKLSPHDVLAAVNGHMRLRLGSPVAFFMREET